MEMICLIDSINQLSFGNPKENERVQNLLFKEGIITLEKLSHKTREDLQSICKIGDVTAGHINRNLEKCGVQLDMTHFKCSTSNRCHSRILHLDRNLVKEIERMLEDEKNNIHFIVCGLMPENIKPHPDFEYDELCHQIAFNIHNDLQLPKKEAEPVDWEARFFDVAKEEFLRQSQVYSSEKTRAERAVASASAFIEVLKVFQSKEKSG